MRLNCWKTRPMASRRRAARAASPIDGDLGTADADVALVDRVEPGDQVQERALAGAGFAGQREAVVGWQIEGHAVEDGEPPLGRRIGFRHGNDVEHGRANLLGAGAAM